MKATSPSPEWDVGASERSPATPFPPRVRWWQHRAVRAGAGILAVFILLAPGIFVSADARWSVHLVGSMYLEISPRYMNLYMGLLLMPFMRKASYRKRDLLIITMVPFYGEYLFGKIVSRLLALPRRDWPPRPDELPRAVRIPHGRGAYLLPPTFADAEVLRTRWCVNPRHQHPYDSWSAAHQFGCARRSPEPYAARETRPPHA